ncbi:MAG: flagellar export chaperone FliS [Pseudomonadota bacterium]
MQGIRQYQTTALHTAPRETVLLLLLEAAIEREDAAIEALQAGDTSEAREHLAFTRNVFSELMLALDHELAPELSARLHRLYLWCLRDLARAGSTRDPAIVEGVRKVTLSLLETWTTAVERGE